MTRLSVLDALDNVRRRGLDKLLPQSPRITVGLGTCGVGNGARRVFQSLVSALDKRGIDATITTVGCFGFCAVEPLVTVRLPGRPLVILHDITEGAVDEIADALLVGEIPKDRALCRIDRWDHLSAEITYGEGYPGLPQWDEIPFFAGQQKHVLRNCGLINPEDIEEYIGVGGYYALYKSLTEMTPDDVIGEVKRSQLRGRGGAGFPTGNKWEILRRQPGDEKYLVCNADEGDPGAYMNRNELESDPHALIEGLLIGGYAMGASTGIIYVRAEYPLAVIRLERAIQEARDTGLLGTRILGTDFEFDLSIVEGAGAFVCGEETALIASLESLSGRPRTRPPFPAESGLWGKPTSINNVETWYNIAPIILKGGEWFAGTGTPKSTGTKVFSLVGKVRNTGLVELPLGRPLRSVVHSIGGGSGTGKQVKAVQTGGPSGGCIPAHLFDSTIDYESLAQLGAIMGSGGIVVMDEDNCMVDVARYFVEFTRSESCGKCIPCRVGLDHAYRMLSEICDGRGTLESLTTLEDLAFTVKETSLCGLGQSAPNPVLTTLAHFRHEYEQHILSHRCAASVCEDLFLSPCENACPLHMNIPGYLTLLDEGRLDEAFEMIVLDNPLPGSTGRVCQHPCEARCRRGELDEPIAIRDVHRHVVDRVFAAGRDEHLRERLAARRLPETGKRVAVVGAGPAGLCAAFYLALAGHGVTVFDSRPLPGGMLRYALPEYRAPEAVLDREIDFIRALGVEFIGDTPVGAAMSLEHLQETFDATVLAVGTWEESGLEIPGADQPQVIGALEFLESVARGDRAKVGKRVVVIGGGNSAVDSARTAVRLGAEVTIAYRRDRDQMPAIAEEVESAEAEGVGIVFLAIPKEIQVGGRKGIAGMEFTRAEIGEHDRFGRRPPIPTEETFVIGCDTVILAIGESADAETVEALGVGHGPGHRLTVDPFSMQTNLPGVYAVGDVVSGPSNVVTAMGSGKRAAAQVDRALTGTDHLPALRSTASYRYEVPTPPGDGSRPRAGERPAGDRRQSFVEVVAALDERSALSEARRCLRCDVKTVTAEPLLLATGLQES